MHTSLKTLGFPAALLCLLLSGCVTPPGPTVATLGPGSDSAMLNGTRGRADAQISAVQAEQYSRQRQQVSEEMQLEQQKRQQTMQNVQGAVNVVGSVLHAL
jgi:hypothetical protein